MRCREWTGRSPKSAYVLLRPCQSFAIPVQRRTYTPSRLSESLTTILCTRGQEPDAKGYQTETSLFGLLFCSTHAAPRRAVRARWPLLSACPAASCPAPAARPRVASRTHGRTREPSKPVVPRPVRGVPGARPAASSSSSRSSRPGRRRSAIGSQRTSAPEMRKSSERLRSTLQPCAAGTRCRPG